MYLFQNEALPVVEVDSQEVSVVNHIEIIPDVTQNWITGELLQSTSLPLQVEQTPESCQSQYGQVLCITYAVQDRESVDSEPQAHMILQFGEEAANCLFNFNEAGGEELTQINSEALTDSAFNMRSILPVTVDEGSLVSVDKSVREENYSVNKKSKRKKFVSRKLTKNVIGNTLRIEEKLEVLDAMLPPLPEKVRKKRKKTKQIDCIIRNSLNNRDEVRSENSKDILYLCDMCGASFSRDTQYFGHLHKHSGERKWLCFVCPGEVG